MRLLLTLQLVLALQCLLVSAVHAVRLQPHSVRISHQQVNTHPDLVIDSSHPHFTWQHTADSSPSTRGASQTAYQLRIQTANQLLSRGATPLTFDSGIVKSNTSRDVQYNGHALQSDTTYEWSLRYWLSTGVESEWSTGTFRTAFLAPNSEFMGDWIGHTAINMNELRKEFTTPATPLTRATLFISGIGYYELYVNGTQIDPSRRLDPGWTLYEKDVLYVSYDVISLLNGSTAGAPAAVGVRLGDGWYSQQQNQPAFGNEHTTYGPSRLLFQLNMQSSDGSVTTVVSDSTWTGREGTVTSDSPFMGEAYSALKERSGWTLPNFVDPLSAWLPVQLLPSPLLDPNSTQYGLRLQTMDPVRAGTDALHIATTGTSNFTIGADLLKGGVLHPVSVTGPVVGVFVFDLAQTFSGTCTVTLSNVPPRILVSVQHAEVMRAAQEQGPFRMGLGDASYLRGATNSDTYITKGGATEQFTPKFTVQSVKSHRTNSQPYVHSIHSNCSHTNCTVCVYVLTVVVGFGTCLCMDCTTSIRSKTSPAPSSTPNSH